MITKTLKHLKEQQRGIIKIWFTSVTTAKMKTRAKSKTMQGMLNQRIALMMELNVIGTKNKKNRLE